MQQRGRLAFVRHGQTQANIERVWHGVTDTALTELGHRQAQALGQHFHRYLEPDVVYASPLQRARLTAEQIATRFDVKLHLDPRLMEFNLGDWEGRSFASLGEPNDDVMQKLVSDPHFTAPNGDSQTSVKQRFVAAVNEFLDQHRNENVVVVAHGVAISIALAHYIDNDTRQWTRYSKRNTAFSELCLDSRTLLSFNKTEHLDDLE